ncbi:MAG TPA: hypothetical protein VKV96_09005 [Roseiarcus sp.]|nr:hypothetical protein [Roseiarcus sp.]
MVDENEDGRKARDRQLVGEDEGNLLRHDREKSAPGLDAENCGAGEQKRRAGKDGRGERAVFAGGEKADRDQQEGLRLIGEEGEGDPGQDRPAAGQQQ